MQEYLNITGLTTLQLLFERLALPDYLKLHSDVTAGARGIWLFPPSSALAHEYRCSPIPRSYSRLPDTRIRGHL